MSLFKRLFGRETSAELEAKATREVSEGRFGIAKLDYEKAADRATTPDEATRFRALVVTMRDRIAEARLVEAATLVELGSEVEALAEARGALEVANDEAIRERARTLILKIRTRTARTSPAQAPRLSRGALESEITASWKDDEAREYEAYLPALLDASVALHEARFDVARALFEEILESAERPRWLHRDVSRARWADGDLEAADSALLAFFAEVSGDEHDRTLFEARMDRARLLEDRGMLEEALAEAGEALEHASDDARAFAAVARYLREHGHATEAREILEAALAFPGAETDYVVQIELALAESDEGQSDVALDRLDRVVLALRAIGHDAPRDVESTRARLLAAVDRLPHAAELNKRLALAYVDEFGFEHAILAARQHAALGARDEARHLLSRAEALAGEGEASRARLAEERARVEAPGSTTLDAT